MVKERVSEKSCDCCGHVERTNESEFYCDRCEANCTKDFLGLTIFYKTDKESEAMHFCSWYCAVDWLNNLLKPKAMREIHFISLPYITFGRKEQSRIKEFRATLEALQVNP